MEKKIRGISETWDTILEMLPWEPGKVLDAGCGEYTWSAPGATIVRCDSWQEYEDRSSVDPTALRVDLQQPWPFDENSFDGVIASDVVEHLENIWHFFREAMRVSSRYVIVATPAVEGRMSREMFHRVGLLWGFHPEEVEKSHHLQPVFRWQIEKATRRDDWFVAETRHAHRGILPGVAKRYNLRDFTGDIKNERSLIVRLEPRGPRGPREMGS